jgi:hypothetical protein
VIERGKIRNKNHIPLKDYSGLRYGKITPTDIDGFMDFGNRFFIFIELKYGNGKMLYGQRLALERLCDACATEQRLSSVIIARYHDASTEEIDVAPLLVSEYRLNRAWYTPKTQTTVREAIDTLTRRLID